MYAEVTLTAFGKVGPGHVAKEKSGIGCRHLIELRCLGGDLAHRNLKQGAGLHLSIRANSELTTCTTGRAAQRVRFCFRCSGEARADRMLRRSSRRRRFEASGLTGKNQLANDQVCVEFTRK